MSTLLFEGSVQTELFIARLRKSEAVHNRLSLKSESYSKRAGLEIEKNSPVLVTKDFIKHKNERILQK